MMYCNADGEPIGMGYVNDPYEEEEAFCEEMQHRAEDPMYAAHCESEYWYNQAVAAFEERGIRVPNEVVYALQRELWRKQRKEEKEAALRVIASVCRAPLWRVISVANLAMTRTPTKKNKLY